MQAITRTAAGLLIATAIGAVPLSGSDAGQAVSRDTAIAVPQSLRVEHGELLAELDAATKAPGELGAAARAVESLLRPHFAAEEAFALPPLGLLPRLAEGRAVSDDVEEVVAMVDRLNAERSRLFDEHAAITAAINELNDVAARQGAPEYGQLAERLALHAAYEVEVLHPASILVGEYLRAGLGQ